MSNRVNLNGVEFKHVDGNVYYGYTISDDEGMTYDNNAEALIEDDLELLQYVVE